ncbi:hypothetical protein F3C99_11250 [Vitellibacter sp. q18]|nr:hypothetical protein [Aequorivita lutea]
MVVRELPVLAGAIGGFLASTIPNIGAQQWLTTCILAITGATVSFFTTLLLRKLVIACKNLCIKLGKRFQKP